MTSGMEEVTSPFSGHNDQESSNHLTNGDEKGADIHGSPDKGISNSKRYGLYLLIAIPTAILVLTICDVIHFRSSSFVKTKVSGLNVNVQTDGTEYHTPMTFHVSLGLETFLHSAKLTGDKSSHCTLYARSTETSVRESITGVTLHSDVQFKSKNLLDNHSMRETAVDITFSQSSIETLKVFLKQPNVFKIEADCRAKVVVYAYGFLPIVANLALLMDDHTKIQALYDGKSYPIWYSSNKVPFLKSIANTTDSPASGNTAVKESKPLSMVSAYTFSNSEMSTEKVSSTLSADLFPSTFLPFPMYIKMAPIEMDIKTVHASTISPYWKVSIAPFTANISPLANSTVTSAVTFTCSNGASSCPLYSPLDSITQNLASQRHSTVSTQTIGSNIFVYDLLSSVVSEEISLQVPTSFVSPIFNSDPNLQESLIISSTVKVLDGDYSKSYAALKYGLKGFIIQVDEAMSGVNFVVKGAYENINSIKKWSLAYDDVSLDLTYREDKKYRLSAKVKEGYDGFLSFGGDSLDAYAEGDFIPTSYNNWDVSVDDVGVLLMGESKFQSLNLGRGKIMFNLPQGKSEGSLILKSNFKRRLSEILEKPKPLLLRSNPLPKAVTVQENKGTDVAAAIEWNIGNPSKHLLLASSFNISGDHNTISLVRSTNTYKGLVQLDSLGKIRGNAMGELRVVAPDRWDFSIENVNFGTEGSMTNDIVAIDSSLKAGQFNFQSRIPSGLNAKVSFSGEAVTKNLQVSIDIDIQGDKTTFDLVQNNENYQANINLDYLAGLVFGEDADNKIVSKSRNEKLRGNAKGSLKALTASTFDMTFEEASVTIGTESYSQKLSVGSGLYVDVPMGREQGSIAVNAVSKVNSFDIGNRIAWKTVNQNLTLAMSTKLVSTGSIIFDINEVINFGSPQKPSVQPVPVPAPSPAKKMNTFAVTQVLINVALSEAQGDNFKAGFKRTIATVMSISVDAVTITLIIEVQTSRKLLATGVKIDYTIQATTTQEEMTQTLNAAVEDNTFSQSLQAETGTTATATSPPEIVNISPTSMPTGQPASNSGISNLKQSNPMFMIVFTFIGIFYVL